METLQESKHRAEVDNTTLKGEVAQLRMDQQNFLQQLKESQQVNMQVCDRNGKSVTLLLFDQLSDISSKYNHTQTRKY